MAQAFTVARSASCVVLVGELRGGGALGSVDKHVFVQSKALPRAISNSSFESSYTVFIYA